MRKYVLAALFALVASNAGAAEAIYRLGDTQWLDISTTSRAATNAVSSSTRAMRLTCTAKCYYAVSASGATTTAAVAENATTHYLPADVPIEIITGSGEVVAAITVTGTGILFITELTK